MKVVRELGTFEMEGAIFPRRRIVVLERDDGHFAFAEEYFYVSEHDGQVLAQGWRQLPSQGMHETADLAEREGRATFVKLRDSSG